MLHKYSPLCLRSCILIRPSRNIMHGGRITRCPARNYFPIHLLGGSIFGVQRNRLLVDSRGNRQYTTLIYLMSRCPLHCGLWGRVIRSTCLIGKFRHYFCLYNVGILLTVTFSCLQPVGQQSIFFS